MIKIKDVHALLPVLPIPVYWHDKNGVVLGLNDYCLEDIGGKREDIVGKTPYDFYPRETAEHILKLNVQVMRTGKTLSQEECIKDITTGEDKCFYVIKMPLYDDDSKIIGILGTALNITAHKKLEEMRLQNAVHQAELRAQDAFKECMDGIYNLVQDTKIRVLNETMGTRLLTNSDGEELKLTEREGEVLYLISMGKSPKEIANILSKVKNKKIAHSTIGGMINKKLYVKFGVSTTSRLIEKASMLKLIPFLHDSFVGY